MERSRTAIISVTDKTGIVFVREIAFGIWGGDPFNRWATALREGAEVRDRHLGLHGVPGDDDGGSRPFTRRCTAGFSDAGTPEHVAAMKTHGIRPVDMVVVNLYQFEKTVARQGVTLEEAVENIDIGDPPCSAPLPRTSGM